jgi:hypothetical protein
MRSRLSKVAALMIVIFPMCSCEFPISSINPLYSPDTIVFEESILGAWTLQNKESADWLFEKDRNSSYRIESIDGDKKVIFEGYLVKLGENCFLDLIFHEDQEWPEDGQEIILTHIIMKIDWQEDLLTLWLFDENIEWLKEASCENAIYIENDLLLTDDIEKIFTNSSTVKLQEFLIRYGSDERAFPQRGVVEFRREK